MDADESFALICVHLRSSAAPSFSAACRAAPQRAGPAVLARHGFEDHALVLQYNSG
jgi:hypothetical protein